MLCDSRFETGHREKPPSLIDYERDERVRTNYSKCRNARGRWSLVRHTSVSEAEPAKRLNALHPIGTQHRLTH